jgi:hypothetical protein
MPASNTSIPAEVDARRFQLDGPEIQRRIEEIKQRREAVLDAIDTRRSAVDNTFNAELQELFNTCEHKYSPGPHGFYFCDWCGKISGNVSHLIYELGEALNQSSRRSTD